MEAPKGCRGVIERWEKNTFIRFVHELNTRFLWTKRVGNKVAHPITHLVARRILMPNLTA